MRAITDAKKGKEHDRLHFDTGLDRLTEKEQDRIKWLRKHVLN